MTTGTVKPFLAQRFASFLDQGVVSPVATASLAPVVTEDPVETYRTAEAFAAEPAAAGPYWDQSEVQEVSAPGPSEVDRQIAALLARTNSELSAQQNEMNLSRLEAGQRVLDKSIETSDSIHSGGYTPAQSSYTPSPTYGGGGYTPAGGPSLGYIAPSTPYSNPSSGLASMGYRPAPPTNGFYSRY